MGYHSSSIQPRIRHRAVPCDAFLCLPEVNPSHYEEIQDTDTRTMRKPLAEEVVMPYMNDIPLKPDEYRKDPFEKDWADTPSLVGKSNAGPRVEEPRVLMSQGLGKEPKEVPISATGLPTRGENYAVTVKPCPICGYADGSALHPCRTREGVRVRPVYSIMEIGSAVDPMWDRYFEMAFEQGCNILARGGILHDDSGTESTVEQWAGVMADRMLAVRTEREKRARSQ